MSLNISLNEKMLNIHNHTEDAVKRGFDVLAEKNASIPDIKNLETMIEAVERYPHIEPIPERYYIWKECEFYDIDEAMGIMPELTPTDECMGMVGILDHTYYFKSGKAYSSTDGYNFGIDPTGFKAVNTVGVFDNYYPNQYVVFNSSFADYFMNNPFIYLSNVGTSHKIYVNFSYTSAETCKQATYQIIDSDFLILGLHIYSSKNDPLTKFLMVIAASEIYTLAISDMCMSLYSIEVNGSGDKVSATTRILPGVINAYTLIDEDTIIASIKETETGNNQLYKIELDGNDSFSCTSLGENARTAFEPHTIVYINDRDIYAVDYTVLSHFILDQTNHTLTGNGVEYTPMVHGSENNYIPLDVVNSVIHHKNYLIFVAADAVYFTSTIQFSIDAHAILRDVRIQIPYNLGTYSHIWLIRDILYVQSLQGEVYGLTLPDYLGNPMIASKASLIANGMTADVSRGAIGQDVEGNSWRKSSIFTTGLSDGVSFQYAEAGNNAAILAVAPEAIYLYAITDNGNQTVNITSMSRSENSDLNYPDTEWMSFAGYDKMFLVSANKKIYLFAYNAASDEAQIYYSDTDLRTWMNYDSATVNDTIKSMIANCKQIIGSDEMGFLFTMNSTTESLGLLGPNFELLDNPYQYSGSFAGDISAQYEDGYFIVYHETNTKANRFQVKWDVNILGDIFTSIRNNTAIVVHTGTTQFQPFLTGMMEFNTLMGGILYTPYTGFGYSTTNESSSVSLSLPDTATGRIDRLCNSIIYSDYDTQQVFITYDAIRWFDIANAIFPKLPENYQFWHGQHTNFYLQDNIIWLNGRNENQYQTYYKITKVYDMSHNKGQYHYHFSFSPTYLFFTIAEEDTNRKVVGYLTADSANLSTHAKAFLMETDADGEKITASFINDTDHILDLSGQELSLYFKDLYTESKEYIITLHAFL